MEAVGQGRAADGIRQLRVRPALVLVPAGLLAAGLAVHVGVSWQGRAVLERRLSHLVGGRVRAASVEFFPPDGLVAREVRFCGRRACGRIGRIEVEPGLFSHGTVRLWDGLVVLRSVQGSGRTALAPGAGRWDLEAHRFVVRLPHRRANLFVLRAEAHGGRWRAVGRASVRLGALGRLDADWRASGWGRPDLHHLDTLRLGQVRLRLGAAAGVLAGTVWSGHARVDNLAPGLSRIRLASSGAVGRLFVDVLWDRKLDRAKLAFALEDLDWGGVVPGVGRLRRVRGRLWGRMTLQGSAGRAVVRADLSARVVSTPGLVARRPIEWPEVRVAGSFGVEWDGAGRWTVTGRDVSLRMAHAALSLSGRVRRDSERVHVDGQAVLAQADCQALLDSLPRTFVPKLKGMVLEGRVGATASVSVDSDRLEALRLGVRPTGPGCRVVRDPPNADVHDLQRAVVLHLPDGRGGTMAWKLARDNPWYVPLGRLPRHLVRAFLFTEDQNFFEHHGFDWPQIRRALAYDLEHRGAWKGASSISQQLVKNVFLSHDRTLSRKLQEAVLTWRLEQVVPKRRILELYLNLVEMAPGVYGVARGALLYFGRHVQKLGPLESLHLAAVTPAPRTYFERFSRGRVGMAWLLRLRGLLRRMYGKGWLTASAYSSAAVQPLLVSRHLVRYARELEGLVASQE